MAKLKKKASGSRLQASGKTHRVRSFAAMEAQIAELQEQIAAMASGFGLRASDGLRASGFRLQEEASNANPKVRSLKPEAGGHNVTAPEARSLKPEAPSSPRLTPLPPPVFAVTTLGRDRVQVVWEPDERASSYQVEWAKDANFAAYASVMMVPASLPSVMFSGLLPDTTYYFRMTAMGKGDWSNSPESATVTAKTLPAPEGGDDPVTHLQDWLAEQKALFQNAATLLPQLDTTVLTQAERRRLNGSGVRRYGFIDKVSDVSVDFPQFWPAAVSGASGGVDFQDRMKVRLREIETLRNLLVWANYVARVVRDLLLLASDDAFRMANVYYTTVRTAARSNIPEARQVFQMIESFWQRPNRTSEEPTRKETMRDVRALLRGSKDGEVVVKNESDRVVRGEKIILDETRRKPRGGMKAVERGSAE